MALGILAMGPFEIARRQQKQSERLRREAQKLNDRLKREADQRRRNAEKQTRQIQADNKRRQEEQRRQQERERDFRFQASLERERSQAKERRHREVLEQNERLISARALSSSVKNGGRSRPHLTPVTYSYKSTGRLKNILLLVFIIVAAGLWTKSRSSTKTLFSTLDTYKNSLNSNIRTNVNTEPIRSVSKTNHRAGAKPRSIKSYPKCSSIITDSCQE